MKINITNSMSFVATGFIPEAIKEEKKEVIIWILKLLYYGHAQYSYA